MNELREFVNEQLGKVRTVLDEAGEPMFCLADLCKILAIGNPSQVKKRLDREGTKLIDLQTLDRAVLSNEGVIIKRLGNTKSTFVSEPNLYDCILQSRKPEAEKFKDWVCGDVLPSIRKHGAFMLPNTLDAIIDNPDAIIQLLTNLKNQQNTIGHD